MINYKEGLNYNERNPAKERILGTLSRRERLHQQCLEEIPALFERYREDALVLRKVGKTGPLGVQYVEEEDMLIGYPVRLAERVYSVPDSHGRRYAHWLDAVMDNTPYITRITDRSLKQSKLGLSYNLGIIVSNIEVEHDTYGYYYGAENAEVVKICVGPASSTVRAESEASTQVPDRFIENALKVLRKSMPKTW